MNVAGPQSAEPKPKPRWYHPTPAWLVYGLLVVEGLLWLSERFQRPAWHKGYAVLVAVAAVAVVFVVMLLWLIVALLFRLRFQFSIRSLLILTVAVALPCSWLGVEIKAAREQRTAVDVIEELGGNVDYDWTLEPSAPSVDPRKLAIHYLGNVLDKDFFCEVHIVELGVSPFTSVYGDRITDTELEHLRRLNQVSTLYLGGTTITDVGMWQLKSLVKLAVLDVHDTKVTDEGVKKLQRALPNCKIIR